jgi:hypothetical protein
MGPGDELQNTVTFSAICYRYYSFYVILITCINKQFQLEGIAAYLGMTEETLKEISKQKDQYAHSSAEYNLISIHQLMES